MQKKSHFQYLWLNTKRTITILAVNSEISWKTDAHASVFNIKASATVLAVYVFAIVLTIATWSSPARIARTVRASNQCIWNTFAIDTQVFRTQIGTFFTFWSTKTRLAIAWNFELIVSNRFGLTSTTVVANIAFAQIDCRLVIHIVILFVLFTISARPIRSTNAGIWRNYISIRNRNTSATVSAWIWFAHISSYLLYENITILASVTFSITFVWNPQIEKQYLSSKSLPGLQTHA